MYKLATRIGFTVFLLVTVVFSSAQDDYSWWNNKHNWDGVTHWTRYLIYSPAYMGPNALPVPEIREGYLDKRISLESRAELNFSKGDNTQNLFLRLRFPFCKGRLAVELYGVPVEHFRMDTITRDERRGRFINAEGFAVGDLNIGTLIQILRDHGNWPDLLLGMTFRVPSGGNLGNARYTDAPGYFFDLSIGKSFNTRQKLSIRPFVMGGFYVWHTNQDNLRQNDAFLYGVGLSLYNSYFECNIKYGGYLGYIGNGDAPMVLRANGLYKLKNIHIKLGFQQGLNDFKYSTIRLGAIFYFHTSWMQ